MSLEGGYALFRYPIEGVRPRILKGGFDLFPDDEIFEALLEKHNFLSYRSRGYTYSAVSNRSMSS